MTLQMEVDEEAEARRKTVSLGFQDALNTHGYTFQQVLVRRIEELFTAKKSMWFPLAAEVPVEVRGFGTRIDLVLERAESWPGLPSSRYLLVAECKRANPAYSDWCFVRAPFTTSSAKKGYVRFDRIRLLESMNIGVAPIEDYTGGGDDAAYQIAIEVKGAARGDRQGSPKGAIEDAVTQVLRGNNGLIEFLAHQKVLFGGSNNSFTLLPVIFTTAQLWVSDVDLGTGDLLTGNIDLGGSDFRSKPWLLYQYSLSPGLKHTQQLGINKPLWRNDLGGILERDYIRTIAVVSASGLEQFLQWSHGIDIRDQHRDSESALLT